MDLLPVKSGEASFPVKYRLVHPYSLEWYVGLTCERNRCVYFMAQARRQYSTSPSTATNDGRAYFYYHNLVTDDILDMGVLTYEDLQNYMIAYMLADDDYIYLSTQSTSTIIIIKKRGLAVVSGCKYSNTGFGAMGKMVWFDSHTIVLAYQAGVLFFNTITRTFNYVARAGGSAYTSSDIVVGKKFIFIYSASTSVNGVWMLRLSDNTFTTLSLPSNNVALGSYHNGRFYIAQQNVIYVYNEYTEEMEIDGYFAPWNVDIKTLNYSNGALFATAVNSRKLFIYAFNYQFTMTTERPDDWGNNYMSYFMLNGDNQPVHVHSSGEIPEWIENTYYRLDYTRLSNRFIMLPWSSNTFSIDRPLQTTAHNGVLYVMKESYGVIDYSGNAKYNFGDKYENIKLIFNTSTKSQFSYDSRFIVFTDTYMTIRDGFIRYPFMSFSLPDGTRVKSAHVDKTAYKHLNYLILKHIESGG